jgi:hypothetical protein
MNPASLPHGFLASAAPLATLRGRAASALRRELTAQYSVAPATLSRWLRAIGIKDRCRDGAIQAGAILPEELVAVWDIQYGSITLDRGMLMSDEMAIDIAVTNGLIRPDVLSLTTYRSWKAARGVTQRQFGRPEAHIDLRSLGPNHVWQADFSVCRDWKCRGNKLFWDETAYKDKDMPIDQLRILRFAVVDHTSGSLFVWYSAARGESAPVFLESLYHALAAKRLSSGDEISDKFPFRGVPQILMIDRGSFSKSKVTLAMIERLGIRPIVAMGARAKGTVENAMWLWERQFESSFRHQSFGSIEELNDQALHRAALINSNQMHSRLGCPRRAFWLRKINSCAEAQLREIRCDLREFKRLALTDPERRRVEGNLTIRHGGQVWRVPDALRYETHVEVRVSLFDSRISVCKLDAPGCEVYEAQLVRMDDAGFPLDAPVIGAEFKSRGQSPRAAMVASAKVAVGEYSGSIRARGDDLHKVASTAMRPQGQTVEMEPPAPRLVPRVVARQRVMDAMQREFTAAERDLLARWPEEVTEEDIEGVVATLVDGVSGRVIEFAGGKR